MNLLKINPAILLVPVAFLFYQASCNRCDYPPVEIEFNKTTTKLLENSGVWLQDATTDTLQAAAVAFSVSVGDSTEWSYYGCGISRQPFSIITQVRADDCMPEFKPINFIREIRIRSHFAINDQIPENEYVEEMFYAWLSHQSHSENLYQTLPNVIEMHQNYSVLSEPKEVIYLFLSENLDNNVAQFTIETTLSNGMILETTTPLIHLIK